MGLDAARSLDFVLVANDAAVNSDGDDSRVRPALWRMAPEDRVEMGLRGTGTKGVPAAV